MLKIQVVGSKFPPEYAGAGIRIQNTYRRLSAGGTALQWSVITGSTEFPGHARYVYDGIEVERISSRLFAQRKLSSQFMARLFHALRSWLEAARLWRLLSSRQFDLLHIYGNSSVTAAAIIYAAVKRKRVIIELVTTKTSALQSLPGLRIAPFLRRRLARGSLIVAISQALAERCQADGFARNVWMRPNPVDTSRYFPEPERRAALRARHSPFSDGDIVLGMVAKFMPQKNQIFLIDVLAQLPDRFKLVLAGPQVTQGPLAARDYSYIAALHQRVADVGCERRVHIVPEFVPAEDYIKLSNIYLLPNTDEGLATPMLESLACGVPVIGNAGEPAFRQWIDDGRNGYLCPLDVALWAKATERAVELPPSAMRRAAAQVADIASAEKIDRKFLRLLETLVAMPPNQELDVGKTLRESAHG